MTRRHVLRHYPAEDEAARFAEESDWDLFARTPADEEAGNDYDVGWLTPVNMTFHYCEDAVARQSYFFFKGSAFAKLSQYEDRAVMALHPWTLDELLEAIEEEPEGPDRGRAVLRAGLGAPMEFDQRFFDCIAAAMCHEDHRVRSIGALASSYSAWPQYRPLLEQIAKDDLEPEVRELAQTTLRAFDQHGVGQS